MQFDAPLVNETDVTRKTTLEDGNVTIDSNVKQTVDAETFMKMFQDKINKHRSLSRSVRDVENQIQQLLDEHGDDMHDMQVIDATDEKDDPTTDSLVNRFPEEAIETYVNMKKGREQLQNHQQQLQDVEEDILQLKDIAEEVADEYEDIELPNNFELVMEDIEDE